MATTAAQGLVATGTSIKTILQIATPANRQAQLISWGFTISAGQSGEIELMQTDVGATVTAHIASGVQPLDPNAPASLMTLGTTATGYNATVEGSITATRMFDTQITTTTSLPYYEYQWMPDERPILAVSKFLRIRATMGVGVNISAWAAWDE